jgi:hypothetical protein
MIRRLSNQKSESSYMLQRDTLRFDAEYFFQDNEKYRDSTPSRFFHRKVEAVQFLNTFVKKLSDFNAGLSTWHP